jgi:hypothetical protein
MLAALSDQSQDGDFLELARWPRMKRRSVPVLYRHFNFHNKVLNL